MKIVFNFSERCRQAFSVGVVAAAKWTKKKSHGVICIVKARSKGIHLGKSLLSVFVVAVFMVSRIRAAAKRQDLAFWATIFSCWRSRFSHDSKSINCENLSCHFARVSSPWCLHDVRFSCASRVAMNCIGSRLCGWPFFHLHRNASPRNSLRVYSSRLNSKPHICYIFHQCAVTAAIPLSVRESIQRGQRITRLIGRTTTA
jgi:hypothetical protein